MQIRTVGLPNGSMREKTAGHCPSNSCCVLAAGLHGQAHALRNPNAWVNPLAVWFCTRDLVTSAHACRYCMSWS